MDKYINTSSAKWQEISRSMNESRKLKVRCRHCGYLNKMPSFVTLKVCNWCNRRVYNTKAKLQMNNKEEDRNMFKRTIRYLIKLEKGDSN